MPRNSQYILGTNIDDVNNDPRLNSYWVLQFLFQGKLDGIDKTLDNIPENSNSTPTDLAIKEYVKKVSSNILTTKQNLGEIENYYGVYSGFKYNNINCFVQATNTSIPSIVVGVNDQLVVKINNKEYSFAAINTIGSAITTTPMTIMLSSNSTFGTEESKYLTELSYSNTTNLGNKNYYIIKINNEYSTVRFDRTNHKIYFEHIGGPTRSQWRISNKNIADVSKIPSDISTFDLLDIQYVFIDSSGNVSICNQEPKAILSANASSFSEYTDSTYGYNVITEKWYYFNKTNGTVTEKAVQLIGMIGVQNNQILCAYSLPCYLKKSQKNTIKLERVSNKKISSISGDNVLYFNSNILQTRNIIYNWIFNSTSYKNTTVFLYIDEEGTTQMSLNRPYKSEFGGYYLNNKNWRCVGSVFVDIHGDVYEPCDLNGTLNLVENYSEATYARFPLGFEGQIKITVGEGTPEYKNVENLNFGINVVANTKIEYEGVINV